MYMAIQNTRGEKATDFAGIFTEWKYFCSKFFEDNDYNHSILLKHLKIWNAIKHFENNKSRRVNGMMVEVIKALGETGVDIFHKLCQVVWNTEL